MGFKLDYETRITAIVLFLTVTLVLEGAYPMWKDHEAGFFYWCIGAGLLVSLGTIVYCLWRDARENDDRKATPPTKPDSIEQHTHHEATQTKGEEQIKLELEVDKLYLTGIGLAFTVESVFIGLYGKALVSGIIDIQFIQISAISFMFVVFMIFVWCDYNNKKEEVRIAFKK